MSLPQIRDTTTLLEFYRQLMACAPILNGKHIECVCTVAGGTSQVFAHGLGRMPVGNFIVSNNNPSAAQAQCGGVDVSLVGIQLSVAADTTLKVYVY